MEIPTHAIVDGPKQNLLDEINLLFSCDSTLPFFQENLVNSSKHTLELKIYVEEIALNLQQKINNELRIGSSVTSSAVMSIVKFVY